MLQKGDGDRFCRRADIDEKRGVGGNEGSGEPPDRQLLLARDLAARVVSDVLQTERQDRATVDPGERFSVAKLVQILANRLRRDAETLGQLIDGDPAGLAGDLDDRGLSLAHRTALPGSFVRFRFYRLATGCETRIRRVAVKTWRRNADSAKASPQ
jgi:hypothetical protein